VVAERPLDHTAHGLTVGRLLGTDVDGHEIHRRTPP
jgi:hypothetical protein